MPLHSPEKRGTLGIVDNISDHHWTGSGCTPIFRPVTDNENRTTVIVFDQCV